MANLNGMGPNEEGKLTGRGLGKCGGNHQRRKIACRPRRHQAASYDTSLELLRDEIQALRNQIENKA